jgi:tungstate transport system permease protein
LTLAAIQQLNPKLHLQILALGASRTQLVRLLLREARLPLLAAIVAGNGGVIAEVDASMMVGGNILGHGHTRVDHGDGHGDEQRAIALSVLPLLLVFFVNAVLTYTQQRQRPL